MIILAMTGNFFLNFLIYSSQHQVETLKFIFMGVESKDAGRALFKEMSRGMKRLSR